MLHNIFLKKLFTILRVKVNPMTKVFTKIYTILLEIQFIPFFKLNIN